jgi:hypothetical protein
MRLTLRHVLHPGATATTMAAQALRPPVFPTRKRHIEMEKARFVGLRPLPPSPPTSNIDVPIVQQRIAIEPASTARKQPSHVRSHEE